jgi:hypothetical protein
MAHATADRPQRTPIVILAGQSNAVGRGTPAELPPALLAPLHGVRIAFELECHRPDDYHSSGGVAVPLVPDCQSNQYGPHFGPEFGIAAQLIDADPALYSQMLIVKFAMGSSSLWEARRKELGGAAPEWSMDSQHCQRFLRFVEEQRRAAGPGAYVAGFLWNQGNSDLNVSDRNGSGAEYAKRLQTLVESVRGGDSSGGSDAAVVTPFVAHHVSKKNSAKYTKQVNLAIDAACAALPHAVAVPLPQDNVLLDDFHSDSTTLLRMGRDAANAMLATSHADA